jgi:hypothetical protein
MKIDKKFFEKITERKEIFEYLFKVVVNVYVILYVIANLITMVSLFVNQNIQTGSGIALFIFTLVLVTYGILIIFRYNNKYNVFFYMLLIQLIF